MTSKVPKEIRKLLDASGLPWQVERGGRHFKLRINGRLALVMPMSDAKDTGMYKRNAVAQVKRFIRGQLGTAVAAALLLALAMPVAFGQQIRSYDSRGSSIGTTTVISPNSTRSFDERGRSLGTSTTDSQGTTTFYDSRGRVIGKSSVSK